MAENVRTSIIEHFSASPDPRMLLKTLHKLREGRGHEAASRFQDSWQCWGLTLNGVGAPSAVANETAPG